MSTNEGLPWESGGDLPWETPEGDWDGADHEAWRGAGEGGRRCH